MSSVSFGPVAAQPQTEEEVVGHESPRMKRELPVAKMQLNMTSMIDVIFQLLIYFVITANFTMEEGVLTARLPEEGTAATPLTMEVPKTPQFIVIEEAGLHHYRITLQGFPETPNDFDGLSALLRDLAISNTFDPKEKPIVIKPGANVRWEHVVNAFNAAINAKYEKVSFATVQ